MWGMFVEFLKASADASDYLLKQQLNLSPLLWVNYKHRSRKFITRFYHIKVVYYKQLALPAHRNNTAITYSKL